MSDESDLLIVNEKVKEKNAPNYATIPDCVNNDSSASEVKLHLDQYVQTELKPNMQKESNYFTVCCILITVFIILVTIITLYIK